MFLVQILRDDGPCYINWSLAMLHFQLSVLEPYSGAWCPFDVDNGMQFDWLCNVCVVL